ncbi:MAG: chorismate-binding protein [Holophagaceae bacterium]
MGFLDRLRPAARAPAAPGLAEARPPSSPGGLWLHDGMGIGWGGSLLAAATSAPLEARWDGRGWVTTWKGRTLPGSPYTALERLSAERAGPLLGALSFELACWEAGLPHAEPAPGELGMAWFPVDAALALEAGAAQALAWGAAPHPAPSPGLPVRPGDAPPALDLRPAWDAARHRAEVEAIQRRIRDGGFYVANLCLPFRGRLPGGFASLALAALARSRPPFGAVLDLGDRTLLCLGMERALSLDAGRLRSEPIKGTCPCTGDPAADAEAAARLRASPKERAEHTMIVDLARNDLGRVARTGSVTVATSMQVRRYGAVQHLVSAVEADLAPDAGLADILRAALPGGSVTGAPKHAVCGHLAAVEAGPRGFYCGALGWIGAGGTAFDLAMPIRTAELRGDALTYWAGGGITRLSDPTEEWAEVLLKARALTG